MVTSTPFSQLQKSLSFVWLSHCQEVGPLLTNYLDSIINHLFDYSFDYS